MPTLLKISSTYRSPWQINWAALLYGCLLLSLLFRGKSDDGDTLDFVSMPSVLSPLLNYSLHFAIVILIIISAKSVSLNKFKLPKPYIMGYIFAIFFYNVRLFDANDISRSMVGLALPLLMLVAISSNIDYYKKSSTLRSALTLCFAGSSIVNATLLFLGYGYHGFRFSGVTFHPNQLGMVAGLASVFFTAGIFSSLTPMKKLINIGLLVLSVALLIASGSRGALLATIAGVTLHLIIERKFLPILVIVTISLLTFSLLSVLNPENLSFLQSRIVDGGDNRSDVWSAMLSGFVQSPLIGMGVDATGSESSILKALAAGGIICGLPVALMTVNIMKAVILYILNKNKVKVDSVYYCLLTCIFVASLSDGYLFEKFGFTSTLLLSILACTTKKPKLNKTLKHTKRSTLYDFPASNRR